VCLSFVFVFISYNSAAFLAPQVLKDMGYEGLGFYAIAVLYLVFGVASFFSAAIVNKTGARVGFALGSLTYAFWIACFLPACFSHERQSSSVLLDRGSVVFLAMLSAVLIGCGASVLWVAQGRYVSQLCSSENRGFFFTYFWTAFQLTSLISTLVSAFLIKSIKVSSLFITLAVIGFSGSLLFLMLPRKEEATPEKTRRF